MKITYLGTAAAEGFPAVFCNCKYCREARALGGKNIRTRHQTLINDDLLIDLPADTYAHFLSNRIEGHKIKYLLNTHSHSDHLYERELRMRKGAYAHDMEVERLSVYCSDGSKKKIDSLKSITEDTIDVNVLTPFDKLEMGNYTVTALPAKHMAGDGALFYIIEAEKSILYAHDTGYFYEEVFEYIKKSGYHFDLVSFDCTNVDIPISDESGSHMGISNIEKVEKRLLDIDAISDETVKVINHFSHNAEPIHHKLEERVAHLGYVVSYDGMKIEL